MGEIYAKNFIYIIIIIIIIYLTQNSDGHKGRKTTLTCARNRIVQYNAAIGYGKKTKKYTHKNE